MKKKKRGRRIFEIMHKIKPIIKNDIYTKCNIIWEIHIYRKKNN